MTDQYTKKMFLKEMKDYCSSNDYHSIALGRKAWKIFFNHQCYINKNLREKILDVATMEEGPEFAMTEKEFIQFLDDIEKDDSII